MVDQQQGDFDRNLLKLRADFAGLLKEIAGLRTEALELELALKSLGELSDLREELDDLRRKVG